MILTRVNGSLRSNLGMRCENRTETYRCDECSFRESQRQNSFRKQSGLNFSMSQS